jgi:hypothetical protein
MLNNKQLKTTTFKRKEKRWGKTISARIQELLKAEGKVETFIKNPSDSRPHNKTSELRCLKMLFKKKK